jgi:hypothetical protein
VLIKRNGWSWEKAWIEKGPFPAQPHEALAQATRVERLDETLSKMSHRAPYGVVPVERGGGGRQRHGCNADRCIEASPR